MKWVTHLAPLALLPMLCAGGAAEPRWLRANLHGHCAGEHLRDDGAETPLQLHRALAARGVAFSLHTPHSSLNRGPARGAGLAAQRQAEAALNVPGLVISVGEELSVRDGPRYQSRTRVLGREAPGNLNHLTIIGARDFLPTEIPLAEACDRAHRDGGLCLVNHPGPGPLMWEEGLWEAPEHRDKLDGLEVYNGQALAAAGIEFESRYLEATAYRGLGLRLAAVASADTHGPGAVERVRRLLSAGGAGRLLGFLAPPSSDPRPELDAVTLIEASGATQEEVIAALRARRSVALFGFRGLFLEAPGLGEVRRGSEARLRLRLSRKVSAITLYREGQAVHTWAGASAADWSERVARPTAFVFAARDGSERLMTSAIWQEP